MLQHFQVHSLYKEKKIPGWHFSFYFQQNKYDGIYHSNGHIHFNSIEPNEEHIPDLEKEIHDLMIYHVYDQK